MIIKILGKGCKNCVTLEATARQAATELGLDFEIVKVTDLNDIVEYGVMKTPGLVVDEKVVSQGKLLSVVEVKALLK
jgi:small redox-active disulfide protein 2